MKSIVTNGNMDIKVVETQIPNPKENEVLVKVKAVGICGSDVPRVLRHICPVYPTVLGHEFSGVISKVGDGVTSCKVGDAVSGIPLLPCFKCRNCQDGNYGQCSNSLFVGTKVNGGMAEYVVLPERNVVKIPEGCSYKKAAFVEPVSVALHAILSVTLDVLKPVAIVGCGTIGMLALQCIKALGCSKIYAFDIDENKLETSKKLGASKFFHTREQKISDIISEIDDERPALVLECAGISPTIKTSLAIAGVKANIVFVGLPTNDIVLSVEDFDHISKKELHLSGTWMSYSAPFPGKEWTIALDLLNTMINIDMITEKTVKLEQLPAVFEELNNGAYMKGKIMALLD